MLMRENGFKGQFDKESIAINEGFTESEVWGTFQTVFNKLEEEDEVYLDITHSFRYIPMLAIVLLDYAKFLKKIKVKSISYGAFEALGPAFAVRNIKIDKRNAPIIEIKSFSELQDWTIAASDFIKYGKGKEINNLLQSPIDELGIVMDNFATSRGGELSMGNSFEELKEKLNDQAKEYLKIPPFQPIVNKIEAKISKFKKVGFDDLQGVIANTLQSVWWCLEHGLIQQGFTLLQEGLVTIVLCELTENYKCKTNRNIATSCFTIWNTPEEKWKGDLAQNLEKTNNYLNKSQLFKLINSKSKPYFTKSKPYFAEISIFRNDLNHGGYMGDAKKAEGFAPKLEEYLGAIEKILFEYYKA